MKYLHEHRVAHRDLKLDNVLLDDNLNPKVADYGYSRFVNTRPSGAVVASETYCGTRSHMSPQLLLQVPYDPYKVDVWALGVMLYIMLNKVYPFDKREGSKAMASKQMKRDYRFTKGVLVSES